MSTYDQRRQLIRKYTKPNRRYNYKIVSFNDYMSYDGSTVRRSSFIPYTFINGERYWLLGSFWDYPRQILTDFGGSCQYEDKKRLNLSPFGCAIKELHEEGKGLLTKPVLAQIALDDSITYLGQKNNERIYFTMVPLSLEEAKNLIIDINNKDYSKERLGPVDLYSESDLLSKKYLTSNFLTDFVDYLRGKW
jgi:hypothetical protein